MACLLVGLTKHTDNILQSLPVIKSDYNNSASNAKYNLSIG